MCLLLILFVGQFCQFVMFTITDFVTMIFANTPFGSEMSSYRVEKSWHAPALKFHKSS